MEFQDRIPKLIAGYLRDNLTSSQREELDNWVNETDANRLYFSKATDEKLLAEKLKHFNREDITPRLDKTLESIDHDSKSTGKGLMLRMKKYAIAACFMLIAGSVIFFLTRVSTQKDIAETTTTTTTNNNDVQPATEKAVLILDDGTNIILDNRSNGEIARQGNTIVLKEDGLLAYNPDNNNPPANILYNTIKTGRAEHFSSLVLADGTKVWLNALSSIHFPSSFTGKERPVEITGEIYFEVAKNVSKPFKVKVNGMEIEVLGTHFNINAYSDEAIIKTTLLEGSVKVVNGKSSVLIKPGQQAQVANNSSGDGGIKVINDADVNAAVAWKNGLLVFNRTDIKELLRQISRWYDVDFEFSGDIKTPKVYGEIPRTVTLSEVLKIIETNSKLQFTIDGKKVTVKQSK